MSLQDLPIIPSIVIWWACKFFLYKHAQYILYKGV